MRNSVVCFVLGVTWFSSQPLKAQNRPPLGSPNFVEMQFLTQGGITYFRHVSQLSAWCNRVGAYAVTRDGTNLTQVIQEEGMPAGSVCVCNTVECGPPPRAERTSVFGALAPGGYRLTILSTNQFLQVQSSTRNFAVPSGSGPTLAISTFSANELVQISVAGVANVRYVVERSTDLISWVGLRTNSTAPFSLTVPSTGGQQFFRASIAPLPLE